MPFGAVIVDVSRSHHGDSEPVCESAEGTFPVAVPLPLVVMEFDEEPPGAEGGVETPGEELGSGYAVFQRPRQRASTAPGEGNEALSACEEGRKEKGGPAAFTLVVRLAQQAAKVGVTGWCFGQKGHVAATGQRVAIRIVERAAAQSVQAFRDPRNIQSHRDFGASDGLKSFSAGCLGEFHGSVQAVVIRERHRWIAQLEGLKDQLFRMRSAVEEGESGMAVQFDVGRCGHNFGFCSG
jgi:hypothetical protein